VSPTTQPLPAFSAASTTPPPNSDLTRLLTMWRTLAVRAARAAAHDGDDERELAFTSLQLKVEQAIAERHPEVLGVMDEHLAWESALAHEGTGPVATCLDCRRARVGFPDILPFPSLREGMR
jgi:hypothetical protein